MIRTRRTARPQLRAYTRQLRLEMLEDRAVPATLFVDDSLVAGTAIGSLGSSVAVTNDRDNSGTLTTGDQVSIAVGETGTTANLTFNAAATGGDIGSAYSTISAAIAAAATGDTIEIAKGTYAESVTVNKQLTLDGLTNNAADVVIHPASGVGITVSASGVTIRDLTVTGATDGIDATAVTSLTLDDVVVNANSGIGLKLSGTGASATLTLTNVSVTGNTGAGMTISGFATINDTGLTLTGNSTSTASSITAAAGSTLNVTVGGSTAATVTVTGTTLQITSGATTDQTIDLTGVANLNITGSSAADTFVVTAPATGGTAITINGGLPGPTAGVGTSGDSIDLTTVPAAANVTSNFAAATGFSGSISSATTTTVNYTGIEKFADGSTVSGTVTNQSAAGVAGIPVQLDIGADGSTDLTTTTDASGNFSFGGLPTGTYRIRLGTLPSGTTQTSTNPADITVATFGQSTTAANFILNVAATVGGTVTGVVFNDANSNGTLDAGEAVVSGATVFLDANGNGTLDSGEVSTTSNASGIFTLTATTNGTFTLRAVPSGSFTASTSTSVNLSGGASLTDNVGLQTTASTNGGTVSGVVFNDANSNGIMDVGESIVSGVTVFLDTNGNGTLDSGELSAISSATGTFTIASSTSGMFTLRAVPSGSFTASTSTVVNLSGGATITANVGLQTISSNTGGTVSGVVFNDANGNGLKDSGETTVSGVTVFLDLNGNGQLNAGEPAAVSSATGAFTLTSSTNGQFALRALAPTGFKLGTVTTVVLSGGATLTADVPLQAITSAVGGTVTGVVFADTNRNGILDSGEAVQSGVTVFLDANGNNTLDSGEVSTTTNASGAFTLTAAANGVFTIRAIEPSGFTSSTDPVVSLTNGGMLTANVGLLTTAASGGTVTGIVFNDKNRNGVLDAGENLVGGVTVFLDANGNGQLDAGEISTTTNAAGSYTLTTTTNGQVAVTALLPVGYLHLSTTTTANLTGGATVTGTDVGLFAKLPPQATPSRLLAAGFLEGGNPHVKLFDQAGNVIRDIDVSGLVGTAQARVAVADVTGDGVDDIIVGSGPGVTNRLVVLDGKTFQVAFNTQPFEASFTGGIYVAAGDVTGDGIADLIVTPDEGGGPRVEVFNGSNFAVVTNFFGIDDANFRGGARAAVADFNNDGVPDLVVAAGFGGGPRIAVFDGSSIVGGSGLRRLVNDFFVFEQTLRNGAFVTAGDVDGDGFADLISGGGPGGGPRVLVLSGADLLQNRIRPIANFFAGDINNRGGIRVTAKDIDGDGLADIVVGDGTNAGKRVTAYTGASLRAGNPTAKFVINGDDDSSGVFVG